MKRLIAVVLASVLSAAAWAEASFTSFDRRAQAGEKLTVVFFGGSLTWSANASDPDKTGFRGLMADYFKAKYPKADFTFVDAALGGTGSNLGMFRLERDVLAKKPDLVFLDFICNDGGENRDSLATCCYEYLLRRMIGDGIPVVQMFFTFKWWAEGGAPYEPRHARLIDYRRLVNAYSTGVGDVYVDSLIPALDALQGKDRAEMIEKVWPIDGGHPGDYGYTFFAKAGQVGYERAVKAGTVCRVPAEPVFGTVEDVRRLDAAEMTLADGWTKRAPYATAAWHDGWSARWMDGVAAFAGETAVPLKASARANFIGLFGEGDDKGLKYEVRADGKTIASFDGSPHVGAPLFTWRFHRLAGSGEIRAFEIVPTPAAGGELHIGAVCTATVVPRETCAKDAPCGNPTRDLEAIDHARGKR